MKVFISGSISIKDLPSVAIKKINSFIENGDTILIGDAYGIDLIVQKYLTINKYSDVMVYYAGNIIRNNYNNWSTFNIKALNEEKGRELYILKDKQMSIDADFGLMIWDGKSKGTLNNIKMMKNLSKPFIVIINNEEIDESKINDFINNEKALI